MNMHATCTSMQEHFHVIFLQKPNETFLENAESVPGRLNFLLSDSFTKQISSICKKMMQIVRCAFQYALPTHSRNVRAFEACAFNIFCNQLQP